LTLSVSVGN